MSGRGILNALLLGLLFWLVLIGVVVFGARLVPI